MDHEIDALEVYRPYYVDSFVEEWKTGKYKKVMDCPGYTELKVITQAINVMKKYYYGKEYEYYKSLIPGEIIRGLEEENK